MLEQSRLHVVDPDTARRERVRLALRGHPSKLYKDMDQFCGTNPGQGAVLAFDGAASPAVLPLLGAMRRAGCVLPVALYSERPVLSQVVEAMRNGAVDYLQWPFDPQILGQSLERLTTAGDRRLEKQQREEAARAAIDTLTPREKDVLRGLIEGRTNKSIGRCHGISERTVEIHRSNLLKKLDSRTAAQAVKVALYAELELGS